jgi:hypothetical protein
MGGKSGKAEAEALDEARQDADARQSAADERGALGGEDATPGEESDSDGEESGKQNASPKGKLCTTRSVVAGDCAAQVEIWQRQVERRAQERDEAMKSIEILKRIVADMEMAQAAAKVHFLKFCQFW